MKKNYFEPDFEIINFNFEDVILASDVNHDPQPLTDEDGIEQSHYY